MKKNLLYITFFTLITASLSLNFKRDPKNPPTQRTGAPGETTCQTSGCHSGGAYTGTLEMSGVPDSIELSKSYTITLTTTSTGPLRNGFEMTCLTPASAGAGTFSNGTGTSIGTSGTKQYIRQANYVSFASSKATWTYTWKSPSTKSDYVTFYYASLCANGNGKESGDNALNGSKKIYFKKTTGVIEADENNTYVKLTSTVVKDMLQCQITENSGEMWIYSNEGRLMNQYTLSSDNQINVGHLSNGIYIMVCKVGAHTVSKRFVKQ